jgi:hypothetical protein
MSVPQSAVLIFLHGQGRNKVIKKTDARKGKGKGERRDV